MCYITDILLSSAGAARPAVRRAWQALISREDHALARWRRWGPPSRTSSSPRDIRSAGAGRVTPAGVTQFSRPSWSTSHTAVSADRPPPPRSGWSGRRAKSTRARTPWRSNWSSLSKAVTDRLLRVSAVSLPREWPAAFLMRSGRSRPGRWTGAPAAREPLPPGAAPPIYPWKNPLMRKSFLLLFFKKEELSSHPGAPKCSPKPTPRSSSSAPTAA